MSQNLPDGELSELLYADYLILTRETIMGLGNKLLEWKEAFECKDLSVNLGETMIMVNDCITQDGFSKSKVDPVLVCSLRVMTNSVLYVQCGKWIHGRCDGVKTQVL